MFSGENKQCNITIRRKVLIKKTPVYNSASTSKLKILVL